MTTTVNLAAKAIRTSVVLGATATAGIALVGGLVGYITEGWIGVLSALLGSTMAFLFMGVTALSITLGLKFSGGSLISGVFFATVLGAWFIKFVLFLGAVYVIRNVAEINPVIAFVCVIFAVIAALISDLVAVSRARIPVVDMVGS
jgi:hypothetical protein